jgi:uncharacterized protein YbjT (DUF2867 family)
MSQKIHVVTGAFGFSGQRIARRLLEAGHRVRTLTNSTPPDPYPFSKQIESFPLDFKSDTLARALDGASVLYNTYWVRFNYKTFTFAQAVENSAKLFEAAKCAGVRRVVHVSITNPSDVSPFEYFRGKAQVERALAETDLPYSILRPAVLFGHEGILINNIAWALRRLPVFGVFGSGDYRLQPIYVEDFAALAVEEGTKTENHVINAIGPETFTYRGLAETLGHIIEKPRPVVSVPPSFGFAATWLLEKFLGDVILTWEEVGGLMAGLLYVDAPPVGTTKLTEWAAKNAAALGGEYESELARRR